MTNAIVTRKITLSSDALSRAEELRKIPKGRKGPNLRNVRKSSGLTGAGPARLREEERAQARARDIARKGEEISRLQEELQLLKAQLAGCAPSQRGELQGRINRIRTRLSVLRPDRKYCGSDTEKGGKHLARPKGLGTLGLALKEAGVV